MSLAVQNKKVYFNGTPLVLKHADSPESRLKPGYEAAFKTECDLLSSWGINCITATMRGDDVTTIYPWVTSSPSSGVDTAKLQKWHDQLKYFIDKCDGEGICILYLGERTNFQNISTTQYQQWIDAMAPIFEDISGNCIFGWEEIGQNMNPQQMATWANPIISYLKLKMPKCLTMIHNNPGQKPWTATNAADIMCIQETSASAMGTSGVAAFNAGYAVHLHEWYGGFKVSNSQSANLTALDSFLNQAKAETSGYGIFASDYDTGAIDATKLEYLYKELVNKLSGVVTPPPDPQPTNMIIGYSTNSGRTDFKEIVEGSSLPSVPVWIEARQATPTVTFTLSKDGSVIRTQNENGAPYDCHGGQSVTLANGAYKLSVKDKTSVKEVNLTVGTIVQPIPGCTDPNATNYNPNATVDDGSCVYAPPSKPVVTVNVAADLNEVDVIVKINGIEQ